MRLTTLVSAFLLATGCTPLSLKAEDATSEGTRSIIVEAFDPGYLRGDSNYHSLTAASNGFLYFSLNTHHPQGSVRIYKFDTESEQISLVTDISESIGLDPTQTVPHGKIHSPLFERDGFLYFATHTSYYEGTLPRLLPYDGRRPYEGGRFMRLDLASETVETIAQLQLANEGIISMQVSENGDTLYGLTWPSGLLLRCDVESGSLTSFGAVQARGEWGHYAEDWDFICRSLGLDESGNLYGSTNSGRIWIFDTSEQRPIRFLNALALDSLAPVQNNDFRIEPEPHFYWRNWRTIRWNTNTRSFWGLHGGSSQLFEFKPSVNDLRSSVSMAPKGISPNPRNPYRTQLGFLIGPRNTLYYLGHGPPQDSSESNSIPSSVNLVTYPIDNDKLAQHGNLKLADGRRIFFTESLELGLDGHLYTVAWVEAVDGNQQRTIQSARGLAAPTETEDVVYTLELLRLPQAESFLAD